MGNDIVTIPIYRGIETVINREDLPLLDGWKLCLLNNRKRSRLYARARRSQDGTETEVLLHRLIMNPPKGFVVDHINGDGLNNRRESLRICTIAENNRNHAGRRRNNTSGYIGVCYVKARDRWMAHITSDRLINLGHYDTPEEAARVRDDAARELHGEFATLNFAVEPQKAS